MRRSSSLALVESALVLFAVYLAWRLPFASFESTEVVWFLVGLVVLSFSDVWLPRGDTVAMSSALVLGATLLFDARVVLGMLVLALAASVIPSRGRNLRGALASLSANAVAVVFCSGLLVLLSLHPSTGVLNHGGPALQPLQHVWLIIIGTTFSMLEFCLLLTEAVIRDGRPLRAGVLGGLSFGGWLIAAQASAGILVSLMHRTMGPWGLAVAVVMILVMRQSFVLLLEIRQAYNSTIDVLVGAMEAQSPGCEGMAERNASRATAIGRGIGLHGRELERLRYAALLSGLGAVESGEASDGRGVDESAWSHSATIIKDVEFLRDVVPILQLCDDPAQLGQYRRSDLLCAYVVAATAASLQTAPRGKLDDLTRRVSPRVRRDVLAALERVSVTQGSGLFDSGSQSPG